MPEMLWPDIWNLAEQLLNLHKSHLPDVDQTKHEILRGVKPNWNSLGTLPFGQPVLYQEINDVGAFKEKAKFGACVSPAQDPMAGSIVVINWKTKKHAVTSTCRILKKLPTQFIQLDLRHWGEALPSEGEELISEDTLPADNAEILVDLPIETAKPSVLSVISSLPSVEIQTRMPVVYINNIAEPIPHPTMR